MTDEASRDEALQTMLLALCLDAGADDEFRRDPVRFARRFAVDERDAQALAKDGKRLPLYRTLVRGALGGSVRDVLGPWVARLEKDAPGLFAECLDRFLARGPGAARLREVPRAWFEAARATLHTDARVEPWLVEAGEAILVEHDVGAAPPPDVPEPSPELAVDRGLRFAPGTALHRFVFAVPEMDFAELPTCAAPEPREATWLVSRDRNDDVTWRELSTAAAAFLEAALGRATLAAAMTAVTAAAHEELTQLLGDLAAEGVLLGGAARAVDELT